jgi:hypothetical protein
VCVERSDSNWAETGKGSKGTKLHQQNTKYSGIPVSFKSSDISLAIVTKKWD